MAKNDFDELKSVGIDIGKDVFHLIGFDKDGPLVLRKKIKRMALIATFEGLPKCVVGMVGACPAAAQHGWAYYFGADHKPRQSVSAHAVCAGRPDHHDAIKELA